MSRKTIGALLSILSLSALFVLVQNHNISSIKKELDISRLKQRSLEEYVFCSYEAVWRDEENRAIGRALSEIQDSSLVVYLPAGLCRSCFTSLLLAFQDHQIDSKRITVLSEANDMEVRAACSARSIQFQLLFEPIEGLNDIIVTRHYRGFFPLAMKYNLDRDYVFALFLSDKHDYLQPN